MNDNLQNVLAAIAVKLNTTVDHLWGVMVRQAPISAFSSLLIDAAGMLAFFFAARWMAKQKQTWDNEFFLCAGGIAFWVAFVVFGIATAMDLHSVATALLNPEYWALDKLTGMLRSKR